VSLSDEETEKRYAGRKLDETSFDILVGGEDTEVLKPGGELLLRYRASVIDPNLCVAAHSALRDAAVKSSNRGMAAGLDPYLNRASTRRRRIRSDGTESNTTEAVNQVNSGIVGFFDRYPRIPYCRQTAYTMEHADRFIKALPFIRAVSNVFSGTVPDRWAAQMKKIEETDKDFQIPGTAFTTITVNRNWQTAVHKDAGDLKEGFGVLAACRAGEFSGCYFVYPRYRVAVDLRQGDVLMGDVHEWHGNTGFRNALPGRYERLSFVFYYRENMDKCGSAKEELARAKARKLGDPMYEK